MKGKIMKTQNSIIYRGPSQIDGSPIVVVAITKSSNSKTGNMVQTYILCDNGLDPMLNNKLGNDYSICGNCKHRGEAQDIDAPGKHAKGRTCYVALFQGVLNVWKQVEKNAYPMAQGHEAIAKLGAGRMVRVGTYGDGAAVPNYIWNSLLSEADGHTAYSHQDDLAGVDVDAGRYMISADTLTQAVQAWKDSKRTFRVINDVEEVVKGSEVLCPASKEAGRRATCDTCKLCAGASIKAKSIAIVLH
jgi:hypothetical protein